MTKGRPKGGKNKKWTVEEKLEIVLLNVDKHIGTRTLEKQFHVDRGMIHKWITRYRESGIERLQSKKRKGNPFSALHTSKSLSREEYLELENMKLKVEIEHIAALLRQTKLIFSDNLIHKICKYYNIYI